MYWESKKENRFSKLDYKTNQISFYIYFSFIEQ